jgi:hypothetical protein
MGKLVRNGVSYSGLNIVDSNLSNSSTNPVQNQTITSALNLITPLTLVYDNTTTYNVNDYCVYNNNLYRCINEITVAEDFNSANWLIVTVISDLTDIYNIIGEINTVIEGVL